jgi:hypothetical protein
MEALEEFTLDVLAAALTADTPVARLEQGTRVADGADWRLHDVNVVAVRAIE